MATTLELLIKARDEASGTLKSVGDSSDGLGSKLGMLAAAAGAMVAGFASFKTLESGINTATELGGQISKLKRITGETAEESSKLVFAFKHFGLTGDDAVKSLGILEKKLKGVSDEETGVVAGGKSTAAILQDIGINALDASGNVLPMSELMPQLADVFKNMPDGVDKTGLAMQLFGKSGKDMIPVLNQGSEGLKALGEDAEKFGLVLDDQSLNKIKQYKFAQRDMSEAFEGIKLQIGMFVLPLLTSLTLKLTEGVLVAKEYAHEGIEYLKKKYEEWKPTLEEIRAFLAGQFHDALAQLQQTLEGLKPVGEAILQFFRDNPEAIAAVGVALGVLLVALFPIPAAILAIVAVGTLLLAHWDAIENKAVELKDDLVQQYNEIIDTLTGIPIVGEVFQATFQSILDFAHFAWDDISNKVETTMAVIKDVIHIVTALIHGDWDEAWNGIRQLLSDVWDDIFTDIQLKLGLLKDLIWNGVKGFAGAITDALPLIYAEALKIPDQIGAGIAALAGLAYGLGRMGAQKLIDGIEDMLGQVYGEATKIPEQLIDAVAGIPYIMRNAGGDVVRWLVQGIRDRLSDISDVVGSIIDELNPANWDIPGFSPFEEAFRHAGQSISQDLAEGIQDKMDQAKKALQFLSQLIANTLDPEKTAYLENARNHLLAFIHHMLGQAKEEAEPAATGVADAIGNTLLDSLKGQREKMKRALEFLSHLIAQNLDPEKTPYLEKMRNNLLALMRHVLEEIDDLVGNHQIPPLPAPIVGGGGGGTPPSGGGGGGGGAPPAGGGGPGPPGILTGNYTRLDEVLNFAQRGIVADALNLAVYGHGFVDYDPSFRGWAVEMAVSGLNNVVRSIAGFRANQSWAPNEEATLFGGSGFTSYMNAALTKLRRYGLTFDQGGWLPPGLTLALNNTGRPERILGPSGGGDTITVNYIHNGPLMGNAVEAERFADTIADTILRRRRFVHA